MDSFGKKLRESSEAKGISQRDLAKMRNTSYSIIGKYERGGTKKISGILNASVAYLLGETQEANLFKNPAMLKRLDEIEKLDEKNKIAYLIRSGRIFEIR